MGVIPPPFDYPPPFMLSLEATVASNPTLRRITLEKVGKKMVEAAQKAVPNVPLKEAHDRLEAGEEIVILDIREPDEWANGHIEGATLIARGRLEGRVEEVIPDKSACIIAH